MKTIKINNDSHIATMQAAFALTEARIHNFPLAREEINKVIASKKEQLKTLKDSPEPTSQIMPFFEKEMKELSEVMNSTAKIEALESEIEKLDKITSRLSEDQALTEKTRESIKEKLFKAGSPINEYAVSVSISKYIRHHPFTNDESRININQFREKLSSIFKKHDPKSTVVGYTTISPDGIDSEGYYKDNDFISDAIYIHFPKESIELVDSALGEFVNFTVDHIAKEKMKNPSDLPGFELAEMLNKSKKDMNNWISRTALSEAESSMKFFVQSYNSNRGLSLSRDSESPDLPPQVNSHPLISNVKPDYKEHFPTSNEKYKEWIESPFGGNSGIPKTHQGYDAARMLSITSYLDENPLMLEKAKDFIVKLEKSINKQVNLVVEGNTL